MKKVTVYTDGACSGNPGAGGWAAIMIYNGREKVFCKGEDNTTNNRMELSAVIGALNALKEKCEVDIYSDSAYVVNAFNEGWIFKWAANGWKSDNKEVKNRDLWEELFKLFNKNKVSFIKVEGHKDNELNNRCDKIAREQIKELLKNKNTDKTDAVGI